MVDFAKLAEEARERRLQPTPGRLAFAGEIRRFILGGNSTFTVVHGDTRFTYKVKSAAKDRSKNWSTGNQDRSVFFVSVLTGPSNESDFQYMGLLRLDPICGEYNFSTTAKSKVSRDAPSFITFMRAWNNVEFRCQWPATLEFWHEGQCCVCGRKLTVPESIAMGIGPECASGGM